MHAAPSRLSSQHRDRSPRVASIALTVGGAAAVTAWVLAAVLRLSQDAVVLTVMTLAFVASWIVTNHRPPSSHRVTLVPVRVRTH